jgi:hypothetical protein
VKKSILILPGSELVKPSAPNMRVLAAAGRFQGSDDLMSDRRPNPAVDDFEEAIEFSYYDSFSVAAAAAMPVKTVLFQSPISAAKTLAQTNMRKQGSLPSDERFKVLGIRIEMASNTNPTDAVNLLQNVSVVFKVRTKPYFEGTIEQAPAGCGLQMTAAAQVGTAPAGASAIFSLVNGHLDPRAGWLYSGKGVAIGVNEGFDVTFTAETAFNFVAAGSNPPGVGTFLKVFLDGIAYRGIS